VVEPLDGYFEGLYNKRYGETFDVQPKLVGGFNPLKNISQNGGNLPQIGMKIPKIFETTLLSDHAMPGIGQ